MLRRFGRKWGGINVRVMLDTNIFISTIFFPSNQTRELVKRLTENHQIVICDYVIEELRLVTERKFPQKRFFLERFFMELPFELVYTPKVLDLDGFPEMRDAKDSPILATAILEEIDVFLTGDKDFLVLDVEIPEIMSMSEFLEKY
jgi:putative PIN family toxin of toxin-antitoxin system